MFGALTMIAVACHQSPPTDGGAAIKSQQGALAPVAAATALPADGKVPPRRDYAAIVQAPDRSPEDRALDPGRHPEQFLVFLDLPVNAHVAEAVDTLPNCWRACSARKGRYSRRTRDGCSNVSPSGL
jgi:hypothetical protein